MPGNGFLKSFSGKTLWQCNLVQFSVSRFFWLVSQVFRIKGYSISRASISLKIVYSDSIQLIVPALLILEITGQWDKVVMLHGC